MSSRWIFVLCLGVIGGCETSKNVQAPPDLPPHAQVEVKANNPPVEDSINRASFEKIRIGMTEAEVRGILGRQADKDWNWSTMGTRSSCWNGANATITVDFEFDGKVVGKKTTP